MTDLTGDGKADVFNFYYDDIFMSFQKPQGFDNLVVIDTDQELYIQTSQSYSNLYFDGNSNGSIDIMVAVFDPREMTTDKAFDFYVGALLSNISSHRVLSPSEKLLLREWSANNTKASEETKLILYSDDILDILGIDEKDYDEADLEWVPDVEEEEWYKQKEEEFNDKVDDLYKNIVGRYTSKDLQKAIKSKHEISFNCKEYYLVNSMYDESIIKWIKEI
jgi:hypothetical protein